jgi:hypothetical protein
MRWSSHVAPVAKTNAYRVLVGRSRAKDHSEDLVIDGMLTLRSTGKKGFGLDSCQWSCMLFKTPVYNAGFTSIVEE